jgi:hypothetical protein
MIGNCLSPAHDSFTSVNTSRTVDICKYLRDISIPLYRLFGEVSKHTGLCSSHDSHYLPIRQFIIDANSVLGLLHRLIVGDIADVSERRELTSTCQYIVRMKRAKWCDTDYVFTFIHGAHTTAALWWVVGEILAGAIFFVDTGTEDRCTAV